MKKSAPSPHRLSNLIFLARLTIGLLLLSSSTFAQGTFPGFEDIPWGSDPSTVSNKLISTGQDRAYKGNGTPNPAGWNSRPLAKLCLFEIGPPALVEIYTGKYNEHIECYYSNNELGMVLYSPPGQLIFNPRKMISMVDQAYGKVAPKKIRRDVPMLPEWGRLDPKMEYMQTFDWENDEGLARLFCKTWPVDDKRQVYRIIYTSKVIAAKADQLMIAEASRLAAEKKKREEEKLARIAEATLKRQQAAAAAAEAAAARRAAANPTPTPAPATP